MPCSTMLENAALLVSAAVELYFIKIYVGGGGVILLVSTSKSVVGSE